MTVTLFDPEQEYTLEESQLDDAIEANDAPPETTAAEDMFRHVPGALYRIVIDVDGERHYTEGNFEFNYAYNVVMSRLANVQVPFPIQLDDGKMLVIPQLAMRQVLFFIEEAV